MLIRLIRNYPFYSTFIGTGLLIIFLALTGFDILPFLGKYGDIGDKISNYIISNDLKHTINSGLIIALSNLLVYIISNVPKFEVIIRNSIMKSDFTELSLANVSNSSHNPKAFYLYTKVGYGNIFGYWICNLFGGINIKFSYPSWLDLTVDSNFSNASRFVDNTNIGTLLIDISNALPKSKLDKYSGELFTRVSLITNLTISSPDEDPIEVSIEPKSTKKINRLILGLFIFLFYDLSYESHKIRAVN